MVHRGEHGEPEVVGVEDDETLTVDRLQALADTLRTALLLNDNLETRANIQWLQKLREHLIMQRMRLTRKMFDMVQLVECVQASALTRGAAGLREVLEAAVRIVVRDKALVSHFLKALAEPKAVPSITTLVRHRLTVHIGFVCWQRELHQALLDRPGGVVVLRMVDSSHPP